MGCWGHRQRFSLLHHGASPRWADEQLKGRLCRFKKWHRQKDKALNPRREWDLKQRAQLQERQDGDVKADAEIRSGLASQPEDHSLLCALCTRKEWTL